MRDGEKTLADLRYVHFRDALMATIAREGRMERERVLDMVFRAYDHAISELIQSGRVVVEKAPQNESHRDIFVAAERAER